MGAGCRGPGRGQFWGLARGSSLFMGTTVLSTLSPWALLNVGQKAAGPHGTYSFSRERQWPRVFRRTVAPGETRWGCKPRKVRAAAVDLVSRDRLW